MGGGGGVRFTGSAKFHAGNGRTVQEHTINNDKPCSFRRRTEPDCEFVMFDSSESQLWAASPADLPRDTLPGRVACPQPLVYAVSPGFPFRFVHETLGLYKFSHPKGLLPMIGA